MEHNGYISIVIALISAIGMVLAARQSRQNAKDIKPIKEILANSPGATSLDLVIKTIRDEFVAASSRHESEIRYQNVRIEELENALKHCQHERSNLSVEVEDLRSKFNHLEEEVNGNGQ